nr:MAG TPA: hypothetical protein [Caudoviricetes sp.]
MGKKDNRSKIHISVRQRIDIFIRQRFQRNRFKDRAFYFSR